MGLRTAGRPSARQRIRRTEKRRRHLLYEFGFAAIFYARRDSRDDSESRSGNSGGFFRRKSAGRRSDRWAVGSIRSRQRRRIVAVDVEVGLLQRNRTEFADHFRAFVGQPIAILRPATILAIVSVKNFENFWKNGGGQMWRVGV